LHFHPIQSKYQASDGLSCFINEYGVMDDLVVDGAKEQGSSMILGKIIGKN
jgi:hypothetical protein